MKTNPVISISAGFLHLDIAPGIGGSIARFYSKEMPPARQAATNSVFRSTIVSARTMRA